LADKNHVCGSFGALEVGFWQLFLPTFSPGPAANLIFRAVFLKATECCPSAGEGKELKGKKLS